MDWSIFSVVLLALGFGFVIFWHELGHFLAAKWAGVKVEQFAVGFGTAAIAWRKGIGFRVGSTRAEYEKRCHEYMLSSEGGSQANLELADAVTNDQKLDAAGRALSLGETEYRLNWLPLGGYVKMLGQDDLNPNAVATDPRAYNMKPIGKRMVIVSAGVLMNILLAMIGFFILFLMGYNAPAPLVGALQPLSPAQQAGLNVGDRILTIDGDHQADFGKIQLSVALLRADEDVRIEYQPAGTPRDSKESIKTTTIRPSNLGYDMRGMLALGIGQPRQLVALPVLPPDKAALEARPSNQFPPSFNLLKRGDTIVAIKGVPVGNPETDYWKLDRALQESNGQPLDITVRDAAGTEGVRQVEPAFESAFGRRDLDFAGMLPRAAISTLLDKSPALDKLLPGDVVVAIARTEIGDVKENPTAQAMMDVLEEAGKNGKAVTLTVLRNGERTPLDPIVPSLTVDKTGRKGLGVGLDRDEDHAVVGGVVENSTASVARIPEGSTIVSVDGKPVSNWREIHTILKATPIDRAIVIVTQNAAGEGKHQLRLTEADLTKLRGYRYSMGLAGELLKEYTEKRHTTNPLIAAKWGAIETRDLIFQFYLTIKRMLQRSVPASNLIGPVGIVQFGSKFAYKGTDYLIWFLSMISANLAVVNFLPIPIVDGGLFVFLIIEKLQGKPISPRAMSIAQVVGLALIASVFIFVTYQDIMRW